VVVVLSLVVVVVAVNSSFSSPQEMMVIRVKNVDRKRKNIFFIFSSITKVK